MEKVLPYAVKTKDDVKYIRVLKTKGKTSDEDVYESVEVKTGTTTKTMDDREFIAAQTNAIKELAAITEAQNATIKALEARISKLESVKT